MTFVLPNFFLFIRQWLAFLYFFLSPFLNSYAQHGEIEMAIQNSNNSLAINYAHQISNTKFGYSIITRFGNQNKDFLKLNNLSAVNVGYDLFGSLKISTGMLYITHNRIKPTMGVQYNLVLPSKIIMLSPSVLIADQPKIMLMTMVQFNFLTQNLKWMFRIQTLSMFNHDKHEFTALRFRFGTLIGKNVFGLASDDLITDTSFIVSYGILYTRLM